LPASLLRREDHLQHFVQHDVGLSKGLPGLIGVQEADDQAPGPASDFSSVLTLMTIDPPSSATLSRNARFANG